MSTKDEIFDYVINSPENTNPSVLKSLLNNLETSASGPFIIEIVYNNEEEWYEPATSVSFDEIKEAFQQGRPLYWKFVNFNSFVEVGTIYPMYYWEPSSDTDDKIYFHCPWGSLYISEFVNPYNQKLTVAVEPYDEYYEEDDPELLLPYMPGIDNESMYNKVLCINEHGYWALKNVSDLTQ